MIERKCDRCKEKIDWGQRVVMRVDLEYSYLNYELCPICYSAFKDNFLHDFDEVFTETAKQESEK